MFTPIYEYGPDVTWTRLDRNLFWGSLVGIVASYFALRIKVEALGAIFFVINTGIVIATTIRMIDLLLE